MTPCNFKPITANEDQDEVFHIRQAQVYCAGDFQTWDPKITTPPGLYLISYLIFKFTGQCDISTLRITNVGALSLIALECYFLLGIFSRKFDNKSSSSWKRAHTAVNISHFPPIFFFSALYYTDLQSLLLVLVAIHLSLIRLDSHSWVLIPIQALIGDASLIFRQTNVFWVAIFPIGLSVVDLWTKKDARPAKNGQSLLVAGSIEAYIKVAYDLVIISVNNILFLISSCLPYFGILGLFAAFVVLNRGVVLGDKSNHVATIHIPQMLYIWPFISFFSFPIILQVFIAALPRSITIPQLRYQLPRWWIALAASGVASLVVHFNMIVHPFTLADNRHYVFYVFRVLRQHWFLKYVATPVYVVLAWLSIQAAVLSRNDNPLKAKADSALQRLVLTQQRMGYMIIWLVTSTLSLVTAPLVEPRYYIIPWVMWRISVSDETQSHTSLWLETLWYTMINVATGYMFLCRTFEWKHEPGLTQRFMW